MAGKSKRALADEAWLRLNTPDTNGALPGQLSMIPGMEPESPVEAPPVLRAIPQRCPACNRPQTLAHGWAGSSPPAPPSIQCGQCGQRYVVSEHDLSVYRKAVRDYYEKLPRPPATKKRSQRDRGAR